jgi:2-dehydropantoate 2-reductase
VMGAGAVGCYYGGMLARAGHEVTLVARPRHVEAIRRDGLLLDAQSFSERVRVRAEPDASAVHDAELVLFSVKSTDTDAAAAAIAPHLSPDAVVLGLQNGVDNAERLQASLSQTVLPAVVYVGCEMAAPGHVKHHGGGRLVVAASQAGGRIAALFEPAGVPVQLSDDVAGALWAKLVVNCAYNAVSAIAQLPYGRMVQGEGVEATMHDACDECVAVARASGVRLPGDTWDAVRAIAVTLADQYSSTAQDLARGRPTEIDHLNGYVVRRGESLGVPTPVNRTLHALVRLLELRRDRA